MISVAVRRLPHGKDQPLPRYESDGAAGMDLRAAVSSPATIEPGTVCRIPTGIAVAIPPGYEGQVRPRSGIASKSLVLVPNSPGTVDSDYRGEIVVALANFGAVAFTVEPGMRIAQLVVAPVVRAEWIEMDDLPDTIRGDGGFGSTGV